MAGNQVDLQGSFGAPGDRLRFRVDAPQLERLGFGLAGQVAADGDVTGSFAHPNVVLNYKADSVVFGATGSATQKATPSCATVRTARWFSRPTRAT